MAELLIAFRDRIKAIGLATTLDELGIEIIEQSHTQFRHSGLDTVWRNTGLRLFGTGTLFTREIAEIPPVLVHNRDNG